MSESDEWVESREAPETSQLTVVSGDSQDEQANDPEANDPEANDPEVGTDDTEDEDLRALTAELRAAADKLERRLMGGERKLKRREVAAGAGVSMLSARKLWRALGFPNVGDDEVAFTVGDLEGLQTVVDMVRRDVVSEDVAISLTRAIGQTMDRLVVWQAETLVEHLAASRGLDDLKARELLVTELDTVVTPLQNMMVYAWRRELASAVGRLSVRAADGLAQKNRREWYDEGLPLARAVGFADLVSFTRLSQGMEPAKLAQLVQRFETLTYNIIATGGGRVIKTVGDEVFFAAETPEAGAEIALSLAEQIGGDPDLPHARVSLVWGRILSRLGDIFGSTVNLAARLTAVAEPGTVLMDASTAATLGPDERFVLLPQPSRTLQGFGSVNTVQLARGRGGGIDIDLE